MMTAAEHRRLVEERRRRSVVWKIIHALGSLHLAVILLSLIAIACAVATFVESGFSAKIAQAHIYRAPWFTAWLGLLIINLAAVTLTRWPWLPKHHGFVITHYGIITLLIGAHIGATTGFEANVTLERGKPVDRLIGMQTVLFLQTLDQQEIFPFDPAATRPAENRPRSFRMKSTPVEVKIDRYAPALVKAEALEASPDPGAPPGVALKFNSARMDSGIALTLLQAAGKDRGDLAGLADIRLVERFPVAQPTKEPASSPWQEQHIALASAPGAPIFYVEKGEPSGIVPVIEKSGESIRLILNFPDGSRMTYRLSEVVGKSFETPFATVAVSEYWPDFEMIGGRPASRSDSPNNPAALIRLSGQTRPAGAASSGAPNAARPALLIESGSIADGGIAYRLMRGEKIVQEGRLVVGEVLPTGWADWTVSLVSAEPRARLRAEWREVDPASVPREQATPGIRARLIANGAAGEPSWIGSGSHVFLSQGNTVIRAGFGHRLIPLDFKMTLEKFEVPRLPGSDRPANFISTVRFDDPKRNITQTSTIRMNHPASFPPGAWGQISGRTLKFSQAQWNPENLDETTLQVLYDPGWLLKWIGSVMMCAGIAIMFYLKPKSASRTGV